MPLYPTLPDFLVLSRVYDFRVGVDVSDEVGVALVLALYYNKRDYTLPVYDFFTRVLLKKKYVYEPNHVYAVQMK